MEKQKINDLVKEAITHSEKMSELIERFNPLIKQYCRKLFFIDEDDAKQELSLAIIEAVRRISDFTSEGGCVLYITNALKYKFSYLCKKNINQRNVEDVYESAIVEQVASCSNAHKDVEFMLDLQKTISDLPERKKSIIYYVLAGYTDCQIAKIMMLSRQYVNRVRREVSELLNI